jgi:RNA recognition motif-containing protein
MVRTKVFVGNLAFKTKEADLATEFAAFNVVSANIITRRSRSLGYGFVELETLEDAQKAATAMNKKNIDGRDINVELAKPREETPSGDQAGAAATGGAAPAAQRTRRPPRERRPRDAQAPSGAPANNNAANTTANPEGEAGPRRRFRRRGPRDDSQPQTTQNGTAPATQQQPRQQRPPREPREPREPRPPRAPRAPRPQGDSQVAVDQKPRNPSKTTLFVANLPFAVDDAGLKQIFEGFAVKSAHVVIKRNGRSKGFGFVELETEDAQIKARDAIDNKVVSERPLIVKIALTEDLAENKAAAPAATPAAPK